MSSISISVSVSLVAAIILGEIFSALWYAESTPWGRWGTRYFVSGLISDVGLVLLLQHITQRYYTVRDWEGALWLSGFLALVYACLEAPHIIHDHRSMSNFVFHATHKLLLMFVMLMALIVFDKY